MATYIPLENLVPQFVDSNGDTLVGGTLEFYLAGTTTPTNLFSDDTGTSIGETIDLNAAGYPESGGATIFLFRIQSLAIKVVLKNAAGATIYTADNIPAAASFDSTSSDKLAGIEALADVTDAANVGAVVLGKNTWWFPVDIMTPSTTAGCAVLATTETTAGRPDMRTLDFDASTEEHAQFSRPFPKGYNLGTITFRAYWTHASGNTGGLDGVAWGLEAVAVTADGTIDIFYGTEIVVGVDAAQTAEDLWVTAESAAVTIAGTPAANDLCFFQISRVPSSTSPLDDLDIDARLIGIELFYTRNALNDD